jgi:Mn2+/Fe2+ NRAMP family transporter
MKRAGRIALWAAISAAFIGPGTVTTAGAAGAGFGLSLVWAVVLSTAVCFVLQLASARLTVISGRELASAIRERYGALAAGLVAGAIVLGCAAFEAGNLLGASAGAGLLVPAAGQAGVLAVCGGLAAALLALRDPRRIAWWMALLVGVMGVAFVSAAVALRPSPAAVLKAAVIPVVPPGSASIVLGLLGTTVVPYNLFLGARLARGQRLADVRLGLGVAVPLGGLVTVSILVVGTGSGTPFSFPGLAAALVRHLGEGAAVLLTLGLATAGLTSAVTAPLAAALTLRSVLPGLAARERWLRYAVLLVGLGFAASGIAPIPAIIAAQAANGALLPLVALFLLLALNDRRLVGAAHLPAPAANVLVGGSALAALLIGLRGAVRAAEAIAGRDPLAEATTAWLALALALLAAVPVAAALRRARRAP